MAILWCFFSVIFAQGPHDLGGIYNFDQNIEKVQSRRVRPVYAFTTRGREELKTLKERGYRCKLLPRQTYRCVLFDDSLRVPPHILERSAQYFEANNIAISIEDATPYIVSEGESLVVYRFDKAIRVDGLEYPYYDYQITKNFGGELHKLKFGEGLRRGEFLVDGPKKLQKIYQSAHQYEKFFDQFILKGSFQN